MSNMWKAIFLLVLIVLISCGEKVIEKPDNLIPEDKMTDILYDLALLNSAKNTNPAIFEKNNIEIMDFLYSKHGIDSTLFVTSDVYYASIPLEYQAIYKKVEAKLEKRKKSIEDAVKKVNDSVKQNMISAPVKTKIERDQEN